MVGVENHRHGSWSLFMLLLLESSFRVGDWLDGDIRESDNATCGRGVDAIDVVKVPCKSECFVVVSW